MWRDLKFIAGWFDVISLDGLTELEDALERRNLARDTRDYELADRIKEEMNEKYGVTIRDDRFESYWVAGIETYRKFYRPYR